MGQALDFLQQKRIKDGCVERGQCRAGNEEIKEGGPSSVTSKFSTKEEAKMTSPLWAQAVE